jgi:hypothetical protein
VAVYNAATGHGDVVGPSAAAWGKFDLPRFQRLDMVIAYVESTGFGWDQSDSDRYRVRRAV